MTLIVDVNIVVLSTPPFSTYILLTLAYVLSAVSLAKCIAIFFGNTFANIIYQN